MARVSDVDPVDEGLMLYLVYGRPELGDAKGQYQVFYSRQDGRWYCTCYYSRFRARRAGEICTHVAAVMLYRRYKAQLERLRGPIEGRKLYICAAEVECASGVIYAKELAGGAEGADRAQGEAEGEDLGRLGPIQRYCHQQSARSAHMLPGAQRFALPTRVMQRGGAGGGGHIGRISVVERAVILHYIQTPARSIGLMEYNLR